jgi:myo-inositol-1(or 4)-monophosphatase
MQNELAASVDIATEAADLVLSYFGGDQVDVQAKGVGDVVTAADTASERLILRRLREVFPEDGVVGEEGTSIQGNSGRTWYVDPLDGTLNFARGLPIWCVSLALYEGSRPLLAVVRDPIRRETFSAGHGTGSFCNDRPIACSSVAAAAESVIHITVDLKDLGASAGLEDIVVIAPRVLRTRNIGSAALALAYVAAGRFDAMLHRFAYSWDYAAGVLLVREAGGIVTDMRGEAYTPETHDLCTAANESLHAAYLAMLTESAGLHT